MLDAKPRASRSQPVQLGGAAACLALLVVAGFLPAYEATARVVGYDGSDRTTIRTGPTRSLFDDPQWPYLTALALTAVALILAVSLQRCARTGPASLALLAGTLPAGALVTEFADPEFFHKPFGATSRATAMAAEAADGRPVGDSYTSVDVEALEGAWLTIGVIGTLALGAILWAACRLTVPTRLRFAVGLVLVSTVALLLGSMWASGNEQPCQHSLTDPAEISVEWVPALACYASIAALAVAVGSLIRRRWWAGAALLACGAGGLVGTVWIAVMLYLCFE